MWRSLPSTSARAKAVKTSPLGAVADVALLAVEHPGAVGLEDRARLRVVGVGAGLRLGQREAGELAPGGEVGEEALLLLVGAEQVDALVADRLVDAEDDREGARRSGRRSRRHARSRSGRGPGRRTSRRRRGRRGRPRRAADVVVADPALLLDLRGGRCSAPNSRGGAISSRTFACSSCRGSGHGKTISSWISPRSRDFANEEAALPLSGFSTTLDSTRAAY